MQQVQVHRSFRGNAFGFRQQTFVARIDFAAPKQSADWTSIDRFMRTCLGSDTLEEVISSGRQQMPFLSRVMWWSTILQEKASLPVFENPIILDVSGSMAAVIAFLAVPHAPGRLQCAVSSLNWALQCASLLANCEVDQRDERQSAVASLTEETLESLRSVTIRNSNTIRYLSGAFESNVPWALVANDVYQFGWGAKARYMIGSLTDATGTVGTRLVGNKYVSAEVLRRVGFPAPVHMIASSAEDAEAAAGHLGYPVVVKPTDLDGGIGVSADLKTPDQVRRAYESASKHSKQILVEKHVHGQDYRLTIFRGQLIWAVVRRHGGVTGDGIHTIRQLAAILNADPLRGDHLASPLKRLHLDEEAAGLVSEGGMTFDSVIAHGQFIKLRGAANVASGGTPVAVTDLVHPDNRQLAIDVAAAVKLDLIGIDLIIEDISRSWHDVGATICEVNADPHLGFTTQQHLYGWIVTVLCGGSGRIPSVVIAGTSRAGKIAQDVAADFTKRGCKVGVAQSRASTINGRKVTGSATDVFVATQALLSNQEVEMVLVVLEDEAVFETSLPFDRIDALILAGELTAPGTLMHLVRMLAPNARVVIIDGDSEPCRAAVEQVLPSKIERVSGGEQGLVLAATTTIETALGAAG